MKTISTQILCLQFVLFLIISCSPSSDNIEDTPCTYTPTLTSNEVSGITDVSVIFNGKIEAPTCEGTVTSQGFVYSETTLPKIDDIVVEVNGENISANIINLKQFTKYYMRTFFTNPTGEYYGNQVEFTTAIGEVGITTKEIENITYHSAKSGGIITNDGGATIISRGVCWSATTNPTINDYKTENGSGIGNFNSELTGLSEDTTYYVRAYATNESGTIYSNEENFTTSTSTYKVELNITGYTNSCSVQAGYFYYEINYKFDDSDTIYEAAEGFEGTSWNHPFSTTQGVRERTIQNNLEVTIHLGQFNPDNPSEAFKGAYLDNMSIVITNLGTNEVVLNTELPSLFICTDVAYKNIVNFNPIDNSYTVEQLTYGF